VPLGGAAEGQRRAPAVSVVLVVDVAGFHLYERAPSVKYARGAPYGMHPYARWLLLLLLDAATACLEAWAWAGRELSAACTVRWDPLRRSDAPIPFRGRCAYAAFRVAQAPTERERRAVAWFYRWHDAPDESDWHACIARFGFPAPPPHGLALVGAHGAEAPALLQVARIDLAAGGARGARTLRRAGAEVAGPTPLGGLSPERFVADLARAGPEA
jgi:hypothetical protein